MTRDELIEALVVERFAPVQTPPPPMTRSPLVPLAAPVEPEPVRHLYLVREDRAGPVAA